MLGRLGVGGPGERPGGRGSWGTVLVPTGAARAAGVLGSRAATVVAWLSAWTRTYWSSQRLAAAATARMARAVIAPRNHAWARSLVCRLAGFRLITFTPPGSACRGRRPRGPDF